MMMRDLLPTDRDCIVLWRLRCEEGSAAAVVATHPDGFELRILADGHFIRSRVFESAERLVDYGEREQARLAGRGWVRVA